MLEVPQNGDVETRDWPLAGVPILDRQAALRDLSARATSLWTSDLPRLPGTVPGPGRHSATSGPCILTCPPRPQVRGHLPGGEGAEPAGLPAQRAHLLPGVQGHPARRAAPGLVQRGLHEASAQHVAGNHPPQSGQR